MLKQRGELNCVDVLEFTFSFIQNIYWNFFFTPEACQSEYKTKKNRLLLKIEKNKTKKKRVARIRVYEKILKAYSPRLFCVRCFAKQASEQARDSYEMSNKLFE